MRKDEVLKKYTEFQQEDDIYTGIFDEKEANEIFNEFNDNRYVIYKEFEKYDEDGTRKIRITIVPSINGVIR